MNICKLVWFSNHRRIQQLKCNDGLCKHQDAIVKQTQTCFNNDDDQDFKSEVDNNAAN